MGQLDLFTQSGDASDEYQGLIDAYNALQAPKQPKEGQRIHFDIPTYKKIYSVFQFDWDKYAAEFKELQTEVNSREEWDNISPYEIARKYLVLDETGKPKHLGDERHIYRMPTLQKIHSRIYDFCEKEALQKYGVSKQYGLICHIEDAQAELENTWQLPIKQRLKLHIKVLRNLYRGLSLEESVKEVLCRQ